MPNNKALFQVCTSCCSLCIPNREKKPEKQMRLKIKYISQLH